MSGFAVQKNGKTSYYINPTKGNTASESNNDFKKLQSKGYKILFQLHSHILNPPGPSDAQILVNFGVDIFAVNRSGDIFKTVLSQDENGFYSIKKGNVSNMNKIFSDYGLTR